MQFVLQRTKKVSKAFVTRCKFGFLCTATKDGALKCVEDCLKSRAKIYSLPRADGEIRVNDYSPLLLMLWQANMYIQFIAVFAGFGTVQEVDNFLQFSKRKLDDDIRACAKKPHFRTPELMLV